MWKFVALRLRITVLFGKFLKLVVDNGSFYLERAQKSHTRARVLGLRFTDTFLWTKKLEKTFFARRRLLPKSLRLKQSSSLDVVFYLDNRRSTAHENLPVHILHRTHVEYLHVSLQNLLRSYTNSFFVRRRSGLGRLRGKHLRDFHLILFLGV